MSSGLAVKSALLKVKESHSALDVRGRIGPGHPLPLEGLSGAERSLELRDELFEVFLDDTRELRQVAIVVVEHLSRRRLRSHEEERGGTDETLEVALNGEKKRKSL